MPAMLTNLLGSGIIPPQPVSGLALIDSGASMTTVEESALRALGVQAVGITQVRTPSGQATQLLYPADIVFSGTALGRHSFT
jgi:hypothetical protein